MNNEAAKKLIEDSLKNMGGTELMFSDPNDSSIIVTFNCKEITSFVELIAGWKYSGIYLDPLKQRQYRIDFQKIS